MNWHAELARFNLDPALANWIAEALQERTDQATQAGAEATRLAEQLTRRETELHAAEVKIQALTLELARKTGQVRVILRHWR